jgi:hypothetical protein
MDRQKRALFITRDSISRDTISVFLLTAALKLKYRAPNFLKYVSTDQKRLY